MPGGLGPFIPLIGGGEGSVFTKAGTASVVFTPTGAAGRAFLAKVASAEVVFTPTAAHASSYSVASAATVVFTASSSQSQTHAGAALATVVFTATASTIPAAHFMKAASALVIFKARSRGKRPGAKFGDGYLGRFQVGQDVPLQVQCVDSNGAATLPDGAPLALVYRDSVFVRSLEVPVETDPDSLGRFRGRYTLGYGDAAGHYAVVYLYSTFGLERADSDQFEVVPGGDTSGSAIAAFDFTRPDGDFVLAHLAAGRIASGQTPYLDEGI